MMTKRKRSTNVVEGFLVVERKDDKKRDRFESHQLSGYNSIVVLKQGE